MKIRVADYIAQFVAKQVKDVFLLSGGGIMHLTDGIACTPELNPVCCLHEQAAAMAMDAYARITGNFAVGYFTTGPGATNAITGLAGAWLDSVPCMFISGQVKRQDTISHTNIPSIRQVGVQEIDIIPVVQSLTKYAAMVSNPESIRYHLEAAMWFAKSGRPGPVWLDIPLDIQSAYVETETLPGFTPQKHQVSDQDYVPLIDAFKAAKRPVILAGQGIRLAGAINHLRKFVMHYDIPIVTTYLGVDLIDSSSQNYVGRIGIKGDRAGNLTMQNADLLLVIGASLPVAETGYDLNQFAPRARLIIADIEPRTQYRIPGVSEFYECDAKQFLADITGLMWDHHIPHYGNWLARCIAWKNKYPVCLPEYAADPTSKVNLYYFIDQLCQHLNPADIIVTDAGSAFYAGSQGVKIKQGMRYITSGGLATMGFGIPASIGASIAAGKRRVMCITGDGSFQQNIQELQTIIHHELPIKIFVINNEGYLSIRATQGKFFDGRMMGEGCTSGVTFPNLERITRAYQIPFYKVINTENADMAIEATIKTKGPIICEVMTPPDQEIIPTISSFKMPDGTMVSKPLEDMYPFLDRKEYEENMR